jgi:hypothetical protein
VGASCGTPAGAGNIDVLVTLPVGTNATFKVTGTVPAGMVGALINSATVTPPLGVTDPVPGNNSSMESTTMTSSLTPIPALNAAALAWLVVVLGLVTSISFARRRR